MEIKETNFLEYLGVEEQNLLTSVINFRFEFDIFCTLDKIYKEPIRRLDVPESRILLPQLYLFVYYHFYFSVSCLLRAHISECLSSIRIAIDATLTAYRIIVDQVKTKAYLSRDNKFKYIKRTIQNEMEKDPSKYPLARKLVKMHEICSEYGSHADIGSFFHRLQLNEIDGTRKGRLMVSLFQFPKKREEYQFYFVSTLQAFFLMFKIFKVFFDDQLKIIDPEWEGAISTLGPQLERLGKKYASHARQNLPV